MFDIFFGDANAIVFDADIDTQQEILQEFLNLAMTGDIQTLITLLSEDAVSISDGGGKATAARRPIIGAEAIAKLRSEGYRVVMLTGDNKNTGERCTQAKPIE